MGAATASAAAGMFRRIGYPEVDFVEYHRTELPEKLGAGTGAEIAWDVEGQPPIALTLPDGRGATYRVVDGSVRAELGVADDAETVVELVDDDAWTDYLYEMRTRIGLLYSEAFTVTRGTFDGWERWDPAIRAMYSGRDIYDPDRLELLDRAGEQPLDLHATFTPDDDPADMTHFLLTTGYLVVKQAFDPDHIAELSAELDRVRDAAEEGELRSWWAADADGRKFPYRLTYLSDSSATIGALYDHPRVRELVGLADHDVVPVPDRIEGILAVVKDFAPDAEVSGFANLPFHNDCGLGGCHITCPCVLVGVQLDAMSAQGSQLHMLAGTWGKAFHPFPSEEEQAKLPIVALETEPGDATVHIGCGLHAGPPPSGPAPRRTIYVQHYSPRAFELIGPYSGYNEMLPGYGDGGILNVDEVQVAQA